MRLLLTRWWAGLPDTLTDYQHALPALGGYASLADLQESLSARHRAVGHTVRLLPNGIDIESALHWTRLTIEP